MLQLGAVVGAGASGAVLVAPVTIRGTTTEAATGKEDEALGRLVVFKPAGATTGEILVGTADKGTGFGVTIVVGEA